MTNNTETIKYVGEETRNSQLLITRKCVARFQKNLHDYAQISE